MKQRHRKKSRLKKRIGKEQVSHFFALALEAYKDNKNLADRYMHHAKKIAMKCKIKYNSSQRRQVCKHCGAYLIPGHNLRVRMTGKTITYYCYECKKFTRLGYKEPKKGKY